MRIGYWSSDVCFSDLRWPRLARNGAGTNQSAAKKMDSWVSPTCPKATSTSRLATTHSENNLHQGKSVGVRASATDHSRGIARSATTTRTHPDNSEGGLGGRWAQRPRGRRRRRTDGGRDGGGGGRTGK